MSRMYSVQNEIKAAVDKVKAEYGSAFDKASIEEQVKYILLKNKGLSEKAKAELNNQVKEYKHNVDTIAKPLIKILDSLPKTTFGASDHKYQLFRLGKEYIKIEGDTVTRGIKKGVQITSTSKVLNSLTGKLSKNNYVGEDNSQSYSFKVTDAEQVLKLIQEVKEKNK